MGALSGRISPQGYYVKGKTENWDKVLDQLTRYRFQDLDPSTGAHQAFGWVNLTDPFGTEFAKTTIFYGEHLVGLTLRVDSINIPASQLKLHLARRATIKARSEGKEKLGKNEMASLKEDIQAEMSRKVLPTIKLYQMLYHSGSGRLWFFGKAKGIVQTFLELFHETFGLILVPDSPYTIARELLGEDEVEGLLELEPAAFVADID